MNNSIALLFLSLLHLSVMSQRIELKTFGKAAHELEYACYTDTDQPEAILLSFTSAQTADSLRDWAREVFPFADKNGWKLLTLKSSVLGSSDKLTDLVKGILEAEGHNGSIPVYLISVDHLVPVELSEIVSGITLFPRADISDFRNWIRLPVAFLVPVSVPHTSQDSLIELGGWTKQFAFEGNPDGSDLARHLESVDRALMWIDSVARLVADSSQLVRMKTMVGVQNDLPDIVKEGREVSVEYFNLGATSLEVQLKDLSERVLWQKDDNLGSGNYQLKIPTKGLKWGVYYIEVRAASYFKRYKIMVRG